MKTSLQGCRLGNGKNACREVQARRKGPKNIDAQDTVDAWGERCWRICQNGILVSCGAKHTDTLECESGKMKRTLKRTHGNLAGRIYANSLQRLGMNNRV